MKIKLHKIEEGVCPYCGGEGIKYKGSLKHNDELLCFPSICTDCGREFEEWFKLAFV